MAQQGFNKVLRRLIDMHVCAGVCKGKVLRVGLRGSIAFFFTVTIPQFRFLTTHAAYKLTIQTIENIHCIEQ